MTIQPTSVPSSPKWGNTTKLIVGLTIVAVLAGLVIYFRNIIGPLILSFILASLIQPLAGWLSKVSHLSWRVIINLIYLLLLVIMISAFTIAGFAIFQQAQSLVDFVQRFVSDLPENLNKISQTNYQIGPFTIDGARMDLNSLFRQALTVLETVVSRAGSMVGKLAASAATTVWWGLFVLLISYFLLSESNRVRQELVHIEIPGYSEDIKQLVYRFNRIWGAFFRGQLIYAFFVFGAYYFLLTVLGTRLALAIAVLAGLASFIPYLGNFLTWTTAAIVAFLQADNYLGVQPYIYAFIVVIFCILLNQVLDSMVFPRIMGSHLRVHPAGILIAAIIATNLIGLIGLALAAPVLATLSLFGRYIGRKLFDMDPWPQSDDDFEPWNLSGRTNRRRLRTFGRWLSSKLLLRNKFTKG